MCGIAGILGDPSRSAEWLRPRIRRMGLWQYHRGPDDWGEWLADGVALGHNRLAVVDPAGGAQPMASPDGRVRLVYNGEIYNFRALRRELEARGHRFATDHSDTEVIVRGYLEWGAGVLGRLEGMFALGVWDASEARLLLARDPSGIKPLYYAPTADGLVFASEPKAVLASGLVETRFAPDALPDYFMFRAPVHPATLLGGVRKLGPGERLEARPGRPPGAPTMYRAAGRAADAAPAPRNVAEAEEAVLAALDAGVASHLEADVPVGVFLSGGVDSSVIAALVARRVELDAFTVGTDSGLDETRYARAVSAHLGQRLHVRTVSPADFLARFEAWSYHNDDPVADPSALALMVLSEHARDSGMTVMLSGEGADELFGGYHSYQRFALYHRLAALPLAGVAGRWAARAVGGKDGDYLRMLHDPRFLGHAHLTDRSTRRSLLGQGLAARLDAWEAELAGGAGMAGRGAAPAEAGPVRRAMALDQAVRLPADVLPRTDRATMAASLEARVPFLDRGVVSLANALPDRWCVRLFPRLESKWLLKRVATRLVPPEVVHRPKLGFELPVGRWLREDFRDRVEARLEARSIPALDYGFLRRLYDDPWSKEKRWAAVVWAWLVLEEWHRLWVRGEAAPARPGGVANEAAYALLAESSSAPSAAAGGRA